MSASTRSDFYSCVITGIGTLKGALNSGASEKVIEMMNKFESPEHALQEIQRMHLNKELIWGFGHRIYKKADPRAVILKEISRELAETETGDPNLYKKQEAIEEYMLG